VARGEVRNNGPWGTFYRLGEVVEGPGNIRLPWQGVEINSVCYKAEKRGGESMGWPVDEGKQRQR
jgi:hypothetical protein